MSSRNELFLAAVDVLQSGRSVEIEGEHGSGRTHVLSRVADYFTTLGWRSVVFSGHAAFAKTPLLALALAGITAGQDPRLTGRGAAVAASVRALAEMVESGRTIFVVDDWDDLDDLSAGAIRAVQSSAGVPLLASRLIHRMRDDPANAAGPFTTTYALQLPGMGYAELESALEGLVGFRLEPGTLSRVFAKSGGNIGLAAAVVDAAHRGGRLIIEDGVGRAIGSLWNPSLRLMADAILRPLNHDAVEALEILALLGPTGLSTAVAAVGLDRLGELEERSFLSILDVGGERVVSVQPPLLVEHFRHDILAARRAAILARIDDVLSAGAPVDDEVEVTPRDSAAFVRLVHEQTRRGTLEAREAWRRAPSLATATALLAALEVDGAHDVDELDAVIGAAHGLDGTEQERAEWDAARLTVHAVQRGEPAEAVAELRARAAALPREGGLLLGRAAELETSFLDIPDTDPLGAVPTDEMSARAQSAVLRARALWHLARGHATDAADALGEIEALDAEADPFADALAVFSHLLADRLPLAARIADNGLAAAQRSRDAPAIRIYSFFTILTAVLDRRLADAEHALSESSFLGLPSPYPPLSFVGLKTMAAEIAARRGQRGLMEQALADIDALGFRDGPLLGQSSGLVYARMAEVEEGPVAAADVCLAAGDDLWGRGALLSAAHTYLRGLEYDPTPERWQHVSARVEDVTAPLIVGRAGFLRAVAHADSAAAAAFVDGLAAEGRHREALIAADLVDRAESFAALRDQGDADLARVSDVQAGLRATGIHSPRPPAIELTRREREIAEYVAAGLSNAVIAEALVVSVRTVESHINRLLRKTGLTKRGEVKDFLLGLDES